MALKSTLTACAAAIAITCIALPAMAATDKNDEKKGKAATEKDAGKAAKPPAVEKKSSGQGKAPAKADKKKKGVPDDSI